MRWFWSGILGELYGGAIETRFVRDLEQVPALGCRRRPAQQAPRTIQDATFVESRLHSLRTRNAAAYKGIYCARARQRGSRLDGGQGARQGAVRDLAVDIHHIFPQNWCQRARDRRRAPGEHRQQDGDLGADQSIDRRLRPVAVPRRR